MTIAVEFFNVSRHYGAGAVTVKAVEDVSLVIAEGEFFSMLGPSGSGKTTCLRMIAGFEQPSAGTIRLFGKDTTQTPPYEREVNTVFQDYALFPHMDVLDNVAYGLRVKGIAKSVCYQRAEQALDQVALAGYGKRKTSELSGGQRQRVALARALVNQPRVLLLDEPLGALDLKLREQMQRELKTLHKQLGITFIYVTHDQGEALSMSDRVAVYHQGRIEQIDTPRALYTQPRTSFVADFVGTANVITGNLAHQISGSSQPFSIRPEHIHMDADGSASDAMAVSGRVVDIQYHGATSKIEVDTGSQTLAMIIFNTALADTPYPEINQPITLCWPRSRMVMLDATAADDH